MKIKFYKQQNVRGCRKMSSDDRKERKLKNFLQLCAIHPIYCCGEENLLHENGFSKNITRLSTKWQMGRMFVVLKRAYNSYCFWRQTYKRPIHVCRRGKSTKAINYSGFQFLLFSYLLSSRLVEIALEIFTEI